MGKIMRKQILMSKIIMAIVFLLMLPIEVQAYVGPGAGLSAFGSLLALIAAIILGIFGFLWFPIKRMMKKRSEKPQGDNQLEPHTESEKSE